MKAIIDVGVLPADPGTDLFNEQVSDLFKATTAYAANGRKVADLHERTVMTVTMPYLPRFKDLFEALAPQLREVAVELDWSLWDRLTVQRDEAHKQLLSNEPDCFEPAEHIAFDKINAFVVLPFRRRQLSPAEARTLAARLLWCADECDTAAALAADRVAAELATLTHEVPAP